MINKETKSCFFHTPSTNPQDKNKNLTSAHKEMSEPFEMADLPLEPQEIPQKPHSGKKFSFPLDIISWNIGRLSSPDLANIKIDSLKFLTKYSKLQAILLQETYLTCATESVLTTKLPNYTWSFNHRTSMSCGVAIEIQGNQSKLLKKKENEDRTFIQIETEIYQTKINLYSIYFHPDRKKHGLNYFNSLVENTKTTPAIVGGNFNIDSKDISLHNSLQYGVKAKELKWIKNPYPSRIGSNRTIDYIFISQSISQSKNPQLYAYPSPTNDYNQLIMNTHNIPKCKGHNSIPPHIAKTPAFIKLAKSFLPPSQYTSKDKHLPKVKPETFLQQMDDATRNAFNKWREEGLPTEIEKSNINNLWYVQKLLKKLKNSKKIPKESFKNKVNKRIHENLQDKYKDLPQYRQRIKLLPDFIEQTKEIIENTISTIRCPINLPQQIATGITNPYLTKTNIQKLNLLNPETKMEEKDPNKVAQQLGEF